jgi:5-methylcytosine-specific restriction endonuclease McrA
MSSRHRDKADVLAEALADLSRGDERSARHRISTGYAFEPRIRTKRSWSSLRALAIFRRDGFVDRYSGERLVYPGALRVLSKLLPEAFPAHPNWKMSETHFAYWELFPTLDHVVPIGRGGSDSEENLVTTSFLRNQAKGSWTLEELGWTLHPPGALDKWDGLMNATCSLVAARPSLLEGDTYLQRWHAAASGVGMPNTAMQTDRPPTGR